MTALGDRTGRPCRAWLGRAAGIGTTALSGLAGVVVGVVAGTLVLAGLGTALAPPAASAASSAGVPPGTSLTRSGAITVQRDGAVVDAKSVSGRIYVRADNVTIKNSRVTHGGPTAVRVRPGFRGTVVRDSTVRCTSANGVGIAPGRYTALRVRVVGCRRGFVYSRSTPAVIKDSYWNSTRVNVGTSPPPPSSPPPSSPPPSSPPPAPGFPKATTTGVPAGTSLTATGTLTVTQDRAVIDAKAVSGSIAVKADNVTIKRTRLRYPSGSSGYPIRVYDGASNLVVSDSEINGGGASSVSICCGNYTLLRVNAHNSMDGPRVGGNVTIRDSYIHHLARNPGSHNDTLQTTAGSNIVIDHNTLLPYRSDTNDPMNAAYHLSGAVRNVRLTNNYMDGGNYTLYLGKPGTGSVSNVSVHHNRFGRHFRYGVLGYIDGGTSWERATNVWHDTGLPVR